VCCSAKCKLMGEASLMNEGDVESILWEQAIRNSSQHTWLQVVVEWVVGGCACGGR